MPSIDELWQFYEEQFQNEMTSVSFNTWVKTAEPLELTADTIVIGVPSELQKHYWEENLATKIVAWSYAFDNLEISPTIRLLSEKQTMNAVPKTATAGASVNGVLPSEAPTLTDRPTLASTDVPLNPKYTFENYIVGQGNQLAHAAALAAANEPGVRYNPLLIYGGVGLGKTHLMVAIGHQILSYNPNAKVKYVTSETFVNDFINSLQNRKQDQFREDYRSVDLLMVDDVQFFGDKEQTQEEFFHTFNELFNANKQIVLTSDRLPDEIPKLQERLVSRFKWGLNVDITPPDLETREAILRTKAEADQLRFPDDVLAYIARQSESNVRELEGALMRVQAYAAMTRSEITVDLAAAALKPLMMDNKSDSLTIPAIQEAVSKFYKITVADIRGKKRVKQIVLPRQIAMYLAREMTDSSLPKIGSEFGGKDHTTVIHAHEKITNEMKNNSNLRAEILEIRNQLKHHT